MGMVARNQSVPRRRTTHTLQVKACVCVQGKPVSLFWVCSLPCRYEDERFENASVEFDEAALAPTYRCLLASVLLF